VNAAPSHFSIRNYRWVRPIHPDVRLDSSSLKGLTAMVTDENPNCGCSTRTVRDRHGWTRGCGVSIAPLSHRGQHGPKIQTLVGKFVIIARWVLGVRNSHEDARVHQGRKP